MELININDRKINLSPFLRFCRFCICARLSVPVYHMMTLELQRSLIIRKGTNKREGSILWFLVNKTAVK